MINKPNNWDNVQAFSDRKKLPLGAYVCKILKATVENNQYGSVLLLGFDISEGEEKDFFRTDFNGNQAQNKKWRGVLRQWIPLDNGSEKDETTKRSLKGMITSVENSNPGYVWNWDEQSLVGKTVGIIFREEEYDIDGRQGWAVRPFRATSAGSVRDGSAKIPDKKPLHGDAYEAPAAPVDQASGYAQVKVDDDELPF